MTLSNPTALAPTVKRVRSASAPSANEHAAADADAPH